MDDGVYEQVTNMATLPGIVKASMAMPDAHWGYGFCVGGVAAFDAKEGIISPGGIGYDINCLAGDTRILLEYGCFKKIRDLEKDVLKDDISFMDLSDNRKKHSKAFLFLKKKPDTRVLRITTKNGEHITLTEDHPIYTGQKMIDAGKLEEGNHIITHPFEGVEYEKPPEEIIVDENKIRALVGNRKRIISSLKKRGLLPLRMNSEKLPMLTKLLGFLTGDGWLGHHYNRKRKQDVFAIRAIGKLEDLKKVMDDVNSMGYDIHFTSTKHYKSKISEVGGGKREICGISNQLSINSQSFSILMKALGLPEGNKSRTIVAVPSWVRRAPLWIKRLYLAGLFGAELT
ncbi:RtcB family protein, partial [Candidatus Micrarchaeota archaeon]|nr:RtcB family protein [Candidatus Micrarchaeota archaeon]